MLTGESGHENHEIRMLKISDIEHHIQTLIGKNKFPPSRNSSVKIENSLKKFIDESAMQSKLKPKRRFL